jgi:hypothetical protein
MNMRKVFIAKSEAFDPDKENIYHSKMAQELRDRLLYHYGQTDGSYRIPNSVEGDLLVLTLKMLNGHVDNRVKS